MNNAKLTGLAAFPAVRLNDMSEIVVSFKHEPKFTPVMPQNEIIIMELERLLANQLARPKSKILW